MTSAIPYDPDDFDNNPFAEQSTPSLLPEVQQGENDSDPYASSTMTASVNTPLTVTSQPQLQLPIELPKNDQAPVVSLNRRPTEEELKKYIPERFMKSRFSIRLEVSDIEKNGSGASVYKNPIFRINATVRGLPGYRKTSYTNIRRTYKELEYFNKFLKLNNLEAFIPLLPTIPTLYNYGSDEFKQSLMESIQLWFNRLTSNAILVKNSEFILFLENNDFHYSPSKTTPSNIVMATGLKRKTLKQLQPPHDECEELATFRPLMKLTFSNATKLKEHLITLDRVDKKLSHQNSDMYQKLSELNESELDDEMKRFWIKMSKNLSIINEIDLIKKHTTSSILTDYLNLVIDDTYTIKESLTNRHLLMRELINAEESTKRKHATIAKLKNKSIIDPARVDELIKSLEQATVTEKKLHRDVMRTTYNMLLEEDEYLEFFQKETRQIFKKLSLKTIENERKKLLVLENFRTEVRQISNIKGGLARLGRENYPVSPVRYNRSQTSQGDSWSGRTKKRNGSSTDDDSATVNSIVDQLSTLDLMGGSVDGITTDELENGDEFLGNDETAIVDAKSAASLLGPSTF